jgi:hypothetical protein
MIKSKKSVPACLMRHKGHTFLAIGAALLAFMLAVPFPSAVSQSQEPGDQEPEKLVPEEFKDQVKYLSTLPSMMIAKSLGMTEIEGKPLDGGGDVSDIQLRRLLESYGQRGLPRAQVPSIGENVPIGVHPTKHENEPTVVANPQNEQRLVAGSHFFGPPAPTGNRCIAFTSSDGGQTWSDPFQMPQLTPQSQCSDPVLAYAPDGNRVYYAYMDIKPPSLGGFDIVVSYSNNDGETWIGPILVLDGTGLGPIAFQYDKPWIGTHVDVPGSQANNSFVYVTASLFRVRGPIPPVSIAFTRSTNQGLTWGTERILDTGADPAPGVPQVIVQGSRPTGGLGGEVLVAWYHSDTDGWLSGEFQIRIARSTNNGLTFGSPVVAAQDSFETPFFLGPQSSFQRWWATMFPDIEIDTGGIAHIVYAHDPLQGSMTAEDGDIRYISASPPYTSWSTPETISNDTTLQAQGFPALETIGLVPHVIWEDHRLTPIPVNFLYDVFYTRWVGFWEDNSRVTDVSSLADFNFNGDYYDLTTGHSLIFGAWTDRRDKLSIFDDEDDVWGARITPINGP